MKMVFISAVLLATLCLSFAVKAAAKEKVSAPKNDGPIAAYGIDRSYKTVEYGPVTLDQALKVVDERFSKLKPQYETAEEAIAETMFGFSRSEKTFIEICIHTPSKISFKFEHPLKKKAILLSDLYQKEWELDSKSVLVERVKNFFEKSPDQYIQYLEGKGN